MPQNAVGHRMPDGRSRPSRSEVDPLAMRLLSRYGSAILATARRYSRTPEDAEDAYQRAVEILLTKAPSTRESELLPWLKTVVKHEAFAIGRQRDRSAPAGEDGIAEPSGGAGVTADEQAERYERLRLGAEALGRLKPQEIRCLLLRAEGYTYKQICAVTGFTYTKVNRCITEGRRSFLEKVEGIESGAECERLAPALSAFADGEAGAREMALLRPHLRTCLTCRARLREYRAAPARVAALVPPAALLLRGDEPGFLGRVLETAGAGVSERIVAWTGKAHAVAEMASAQKVAAVAASTAIAGGGAVTVDRALEHRPERGPHARKAGSVRKPETRNTARSVALPPAPSRTARPPAERSPRPRSARPRATDTGRSRAHRPRAREFESASRAFERHAARAAAGRAAPPAPPPSTSVGGSPAGGEFGGSSSGGGGEFSGDAAGGGEFGR